ncbi:hypothetical protein C8J57DRAFT_1643736 [Mycena rebaudengoi]|nr:hypothetical protein C8J57DRAFT_1643736 [Mycena rebaudengoi]
MSRPTYLMLATASPIIPIVESFQYVLLGSKSTHRVTVGRPPFECQRRELSHVCGLWRSIVHGNASLWSHFTVDGAVRLDALQHGMVLSREVGVSIRMVLPRFRSRARVGAPLARSCDIPGLISVLTRHSRVITRIRVHVLDYDLVSAIRDLLSPGRFPRLSVLSVVVGDYASLPASDAAPICAVDSTAGVSSIHIRHCRFAFPPHVTFASLRILVLRELGSLLSLSWTDFKTVCASAHGLQKLCVRYVVCGAVPPDTANFSTLAGLTELDVAFGCNVSFSAILRLIRAPSLAIIHFKASTTREIDALSACSSILSNVTTFILADSSKRFTAVSWDRIFLGLGALVRLELRSAESGVLHDLLYIDRLVSEAHADTRVCPGLARIGFGNLQPSDLVAILRNRTSFVEGIAQVDFRSVFTCDAHNYAALRWLASRRISVTTTDHLSAVGKSLCCVLEVRHETHFGIMFWTE